MLPGISQPTDISIDAGNNLIVPDGNLNCIHKFDFYGNYICSYKNSSTQFFSPRRVSNSTYSYPNWLQIDIGINDMWSATKGMKRFVPGADVLNIRAAEFPTYLNFSCLFSDKQTYTLEFIRISNNTVIQSEQGTTYWGGEKKSFNVNKSSITPGENYKWKISFLPYWNSRFGTDAVIMKSKEITFKQSGNEIISSPATWSGIKYITGNVTVNPGIRLTIMPGTTLIFTSGASLTINGILDAQGTSSDRIIFDFVSQNSSNQNGIKFINGSSGTISYCNIKNAYCGISTNGIMPSVSNCEITNNRTGISVTNVSSTSNKIFQCLIQNNTYCGVGISFSSLKLWENTIANNGTYGVTCVNSSANYINLNPSLYKNKITGQNNGIYCQYCSPNIAYIADVPNSLPQPGYNVISHNTMGIQAGFNSNVFLGTTNGGPYGGKNCLHDNSSFEISAGYGCTIYAHNTWWNKPAPTYLPNASDFSLSSSTVYYSPTNLTSDPNGCSLSKTVNSLNKNIIAGNGSSFFDAEMDRIFTLPLEGKYEEAITVCKQIFEREKNTNKGRYALCKLKECLVQVNRKSDFEDFLNRSVKTVVTSKDELYALAIDFQNQTLFDNKDYSAIIKNMNDILKDYQNNVEIKKRTLFEIGLMYLQNMYDPAKAKKYFSQLEASFPKDPLVIYAKYLNGEDVPNNIKGSQDNQDSSVVSLNQTSKKFFLFDNYPNPFNPETVIKYSLPQNSKVVLEIFNILGEKVITLVDEIKSAGYHEAVFNGNNLSSGIYIYRLMAISNESGERFVKASKMIMLK